MNDPDPTAWRGRLDDLHETFSGKWALHVLRALDEGPAGFGALRRRIGEVPEKTLARRLRDLRCRGLVRREYAARSPPEPRYRLTSAGERVVSLLRDLENEVDYVDCPACTDDCPECADDCRVATMDTEATERACAEGC